MPSTPSRKPVSPTRYLRSISTPTPQPYPWDPTCRCFISALPGSRISRGPGRTLRCGRYGVRSSDHVARGNGMGLLSWIILGLIAGLIADFLMGGGVGLLGSIILGIVGAVIGGWLAAQLGFGSVSGLNIGSIVIAVIGACIVLFVVRLFQGRNYRRV